MSQMLRYLCVLVVCAATLPVAGARRGGSLPVPLPLFPGNNWWNTDITNAPVDPNSANFIAFIGTTRALHPDFGGDVGDGSGRTYGIPFLIVDASQPLVPITFTAYGDESDPGPYPIPSEAITEFGWIEGGEPGNQDPGGDRHMLILNRSDNTLYEMGNVFYNGSGWEASGGAIFHVDTNDRRPDTWTSADAAGLAILPGLVRYDEANDLPEINHAFRFTVRATNSPYVFPASHQAGSTAGALPMGARLRLKSSVVISGTLPEYVQKMFRAMKRYGLIVADNGSDMYISGTYDTRWDNGVLNPAFAALHANDFEVVQLGWQPATVLLVTAPLSGGPSQSVTVKAVDATGAVVTGYRGTVHFTATSAASLPADYAFTAGDNGQHVFTVSSLPAGYTTVTATDTAPQSTITGSVLLSSGPRPPTGVVATVSGPTQIDVSWETPAGGATSYIVQRRTPSTAYTTAPCTVVGTTCQDTNAPGPATWVYRVCADSVSTPTCSLPDIATVFPFSDDPIVAGVTPVKAQHITELQNAVNTMLTSPQAFTPAASNGPIQAAQLQELQDAIDLARSQLGLPPNSRHDATYDNTVTVKAPNIQELRNATK